MIDDKVLQTAFAPFIRSRKVYFRATGMRPNTRVYAFFDGKHISDSATGNYVNNETFVQYGADVNDNSNIFKNVTTFPNATNQTLDTDPNGTVEGAFIIPNNSTLSFRTGTREFKLMDITGTEEEFAGTIAKTNYTAEGLIDTKQGSYHSTRVITVQGAGQLHYSSYSGGDDGDDDGHDDTSGNTGGGVEGGDPGDPGAGDNPGNGTGNSSPGNDEGMALCLLEDMKVMLNGRISEVTNVKVGDVVSYGKVIEVMQKHMRKSYYVINDELKITNDHPVMVNGSWKRTSKSFEWRRYYFRKNFIRG